MLPFEPLTATAFAPYGEVIAIDNAAKCLSINAGYTERYHALASVESGGGGNIAGRTAISIFRSTPLALPLHLTRVERHPHGSQAFYPLSGSPYLVLVAAPGDFDPATLRLFLARADQGVNYRAGTWHHFCLALDKVSDFLVVDRVDGGPNCDEIDLPTPLHIAAAEIAAVRAEAGAA